MYEEEMTVTVFNDAFTAGSHRLEFTVISWSSVKYS